MNFALAGPILIALTNICIAAVLAWTATGTHTPVVFALAIGGVAVLMVAQFALWRWVHAKVPLSLSYPMTAIMYPGFAALAWIQTGHISLTQALGVTLVMLAIVICMSTVRDERPAS